MVFSPEKYEILHFSRRSDNLQLKLRLGNVILKPKEEVRVLGVYLDAKLHWHKHQRIILQKAQKALSSLSRTSYSTWGFPVLTARLVYTAILRSVLSYAVGIWFNPLRKSSNISSLIIFQNKYLRLIGGAFKATSSFLLESELFLLPLDLYFKLRKKKKLCWMAGVLPKTSLQQCYDPGDGSHSFVGNQAAGQARGHHGSQVTNQQGVT